MRPPGISLVSRAVVGLDQRAILVRQEQELGVAIVEHLLERIGRRHGRQRHDAGAGAQAAHEGLEILDRVAGQDGDLVALADAHGGERARDLVDAVVELAPRSGVLPSHTTARLSGNCAGVAARCGSGSRRSRESPRATAAAPAACRERVRRAHRLTSSARPSRPGRRPSSRRRGRPRDGRPASGPCPAPSWSPAPSARRRRRRR